MKRTKIFSFLIVFFCGVVLIACQDTSSAVSGDAPFVVAVVWPNEARNDLFWKGVQMAADDLNENGGVAGQRVVLQWYDDGNDPREAKALAQKLADNPNVDAVLGHYSSEVALAVAPIYQFGGKLWISPGATTSRLTLPDSALVVRTIPSVTLVAEQLADFAAKRGFARLLLISAKDEYGLSLGNSFEQRARENGLVIVDRRAYREGEVDFSSHLTDWQTLAFDAIFLAGRPPEAPHFIIQARQLGVQAPIFGGTGLYTPDLITLGGEEVEGTIAASFYHVDETKPEVERFVQVFQERYTFEPDFWAAQGYDALQLLAEGVQRAGTREPREVAYALYDFQSWTGMAGTYTFLGNGEVSKPVVLEIVQGEAFQYFMNTAVDENTPKAGMVVSLGGNITDSGFNLLSWRGMQEAEHDFGINIDFRNTPTQEDFVKNIEEFVQKHYDVIVTVGAEGAEAVQTAAEQNPYIRFAVIDVDFLTAPNILNSTFAVDEASFLAGYLAAGVTQTGKVGTYGGMQITPVVQFMVGFERGITYYNQRHGTTVQLLGWNTAENAGLFSDDWTNFELGQALAETLYDQGADILFPVAGDVGVGSAAVAQARGLMLIGVDTDWYYSVPKYRAVYLTSVLKNVNLVAYEAVRLLQEEGSLGGLATFGLEDGGVGLADYHAQGNKIPYPLKVELKQVQAALMTGQISTGWAEYLQQVGDQ